MNFENKIVVITGAASGIGAAVASNFAKLNAGLCLVDINEKDLLKSKAECEKLSKGKVIAVVADLSKDKDVKKIVEENMKELGRIDILVNCAGMYRFARLQDPDIIEVFDKIMSINLRGMIVLTKQALPALIESKGCVVNISSIASSAMKSGLLSYGISKAGVKNFTQGLALELASHGVRVNCVSPGPVKTNILLNAGVPEARLESLWKASAESLPLKKCVNVQEIATLVLFLASENAASITGADFVADAGMSLQWNAVTDIPSTYN